MQQNIAALLCYVLGWLSGLVFFFIDKRPFVRFHAMQSMLLFGGIHVLHLVLSWVLFPALRLWALLFAVSGVLSLISLILWVLLMVKAYQNEWYKVPVIGDIADPQHVREMLLAAQHDASGPAGAPSWGTATQDF